MRGSIAIRGVVVSALLAAGAAVRADDDKPAEVVPAAEAGAHVGEECTVELTVRASKNGVHRREYYLDSEEDFRDEKNLAVVISHDHADAFARAGIEDPAEHYRGKTIRVTGKVVREGDQVRIRVDDPGKIAVVEAKP